MDTYGDQLKWLIRTSIEQPLTTLVALSLVALLVFAVLCLLLRLASSRTPEIRVYSQERYYLDPNSGISYKFPDYSQLSVNPSHDYLKHCPTVDLSLVIPAYNEETRLPVMMADAIELLESRRQSGSFTYEIILVDDGSKDKTTHVGLREAKKLPPGVFRVLTLKKNRGKGGAVRLGVLSSRGRRILFADADGATEFKDLAKLESWLSENQNGHPIIAIGSRAHLEQQALAERSFFRNILMKGFHFLVWFFTVRSIRDTQCGFKLFDREAARRLFPYLHVERWAFDVELIFLAESLGIQVGEVSVNWHEVEGSKIVPVLSWIQMGRDVLLISLKYAIGAWAVPHPQVVARHPPRFQFIKSAVRSKKSD